MENPTDITVEKDLAFMQEALALARAQLGQVWPDPAVGCVIVKDDQVIGRGATQPGGGPHAELVALSEAGERAYGGAAYVTLEPCNEWGQNAPCTEVLLESGLARMLIAAENPDPGKTKGGLARLKAAGLDVQVGLGQAEAIDICAGYFHRLRTGQPMISAMHGDDISTEDLFYGSSFFDAVLLGLADWIEVGSTAVTGRLLVLVDDPSVAPADLIEKLKRHGDPVWIAIAADRAPGRRSVLENTCQGLIPIPTVEGGHLDIVHLANQLGHFGLTRIVTSGDTAIADRLAAADLLAS